MPAGLSCRNKSDISRRSGGRWRAPDVARRRAKRKLRLAPGAPTPRKRVAPLGRGAADFRSPFPCRRMLVPPSLSASRRRSCNSHGLREGSFRHACPSGCVPGSRTSLTAGSEFAGDIVCFTTVSPHQRCRSRSMSKIKYLSFKDELRLWDRTLDFLKRPSTSS